MNRLKGLLDSQVSAGPQKGFWPLLTRVREVVDSISGLLSAIAGMLLVFVSPVIVVVGALHGLIWFLITFWGVVGGLGLYVERRMGSSLQLGDYNFA